MTFATPPPGGDRAGAAFALARYCIDATLSDETRIGCIAEIDRDFEDPEIRDHVLNVTRGLVTTGQLTSDEVTFDHLPQEGSAGEMFRFLQDLFQHEPS